MGEAAQHPGTSPARGIRGGAPWKNAAPRLRRAAALLVGGTLLAGLCQLQTAPGAYAAASTGSRTANVTVDSLTPAVPVKGGTISVTGTVTNDGSQTITGAHVGLRIAPGGPLSSRSAMSDAASRSSYSTADGYEISGHEATVKDIAPGISRPFSISIPVSALGLGSDGVYQLGVSITGQTRSAGYERILGIERTFLPWYESGGAKKTQLTYLWPLIDRPHLAVRSDTDGQKSPIFLDDDLAEELSPGGRLRQLLDLGRDLPVTWVIDPDLLATVDAMTKNYQVAGAGGDLVHTTSGTGTAMAKQWLSDLRDAVAGHTVMALPFADPDIASIAHHGKQVPGTLGRLETATALAINTVEPILGTVPETDTAWPVDGAVDSSVIAVATSAGADKVIARSDSLSDSGSLDYTPTAARPIGGGTTAVVADSALSTSFQGDMLNAGNETLAVQKFISQTLLITEQAPEKQRSIVVAPQRMPTTSQAQAMADAISTVQQSGWAKAIPFSAAAKATPDPDANRKVPGSGSYPRSLRSHELSTGAFQQIQAAQNGLNGFRVILSHQDRVDTPFTTAILRSMSAEWRGDKAGGQAFRDAVGNYLQELRGLVHLLSKTGTLTLSGRSATIPVTVKNELGQAVSGLELRLTSSQSNSLTVGEPQQVTVGGGHTRSLKFGATARRNGLTTVTAQLYTKNGARYGQPMTFKVYVTSITSTVMLVIAVGLLLLVLAGVRMYHQRKRKAAAAADGDNEDGGDGNGDNGSGPDPEQPGDLASDTSPESIEPSATGEKVDR